MNNKEKMPYEAAKKYDQPFDLVGESKKFGFRIINVYQYLTEQAQKKEYTLSKQLLLKGTQIGDFVRQKDYLSAFLAASSAKYWIEMEVNGGWVSEAQAKPLMEDCETLVKYLYVITHKKGTPSNSPVKGDDKARAQKEEEPKSFKQKESPTF